MIANLDPFSPPLIGDMDSGHRGPIKTTRTIEKYIRAGVASAHLEDQVLTKRCGQLSGKKVVAQDEYLAQIPAAHAARTRLRSDVVLIARTDALQTLGYGGCTARLRTARSEGADAGLLEGFASKEQLAQVVKNLAPWPLLLNAVKNGKSPVITIDEARERGFRIIIFNFLDAGAGIYYHSPEVVPIENQGIVGTPADIAPVKLLETVGRHGICIFSNVY
ncbi:hypothetical protein DL768_006509 [Monosporascus sp. mg162]|nr:hypothetical protein DL768_006509 [Monosporascus sp. mg162]